MIQRIDRIQLLLLAGVLTAAMAAATAHAQAPQNTAKDECRIPAERAGNTDWFRDAGWGVFVHYLYDVQCVGSRIANTGGSANWDECVREFDTEKFAEQIKETGARYVIFTMMQRTRYLIAPNATYDKMTGYKPGEACATRDLVEDLYQSLGKRGIKLMLYWTGDGPRQDAKAAKAMGYAGNTPSAFVQKWADVAAEYGERYKDKVLGWWVDGCYGHTGYNEEKWAILAKGLRAGYARRIIALNNPKMSSSNSSTLQDDFTTGEQNSFGEVPGARWRNGVQWHILSYLGGDWCSPGVRYSREWMADYVRRCNKAGGVVSVDVLLFRDGTIERSHIETLKGMNRLIAEVKNRKPIPEGNLACWKPARLLSLDGKRELGPSGGGSQGRMAWYGVDGKPETGAQAGGEFPWTYEVDLEQAASISRVVITFGKDCFATRFEAMVSPDGKTWQKAAEKSDHDGGRIELKFAPMPARFVRIAGLKPDAQGQKGAQMQIAELEVYP